MRKENMKISTMMLNSKLSLLQEAIKKLTMYNFLKK